jgi:hypothetical protein
MRSDNKVRMAELTTNGAMKAMTPNDEASVFSFIAILGVLNRGFT